MLSHLFPRTSAMQWNKITQALMALQRIDELYRDVDQDTNILIQDKVLSPMR